MGSLPRQVAQPAQFESDVCAMEKKIYIGVWWRFVSKEKPSPTAADVAMAVGLEPSGIRKYLRGDRAIGNWQKLLSLPQSPEASRLLRALANEELETVREIEATRQTASAMPTAEAGPPPVPALTDTDGIHSFFLSLFNLTRDELMWSWEQFEKMSAADTVKQLERHGLAKWGQAWWTLIRNWEKSEPGREVSLNQEVSRSLWMRQKIDEYRHGQRANPEKDRWRSQLAVYSELEGIEDRIRQTAIPRAAHSNRLFETGKGSATYEHDNDTFRNVTMEAYERMAKILDGEQRPLLESTTQNLTSNFFLFVELWKRQLANPTEENGPVESKADALYDDVRVQRARLQALTHADEPDQLSLSEIQGLIKGADVQLRGQFLADKISQAEGPFENRPYHSSFPGELSKAYCQALKHSLETSLKNYGHFSQAQRRQALELIHPRFHQALSNRLRGQYDNRPHHNYTFREWRDLVANMVEHELVGF